MPARRLEPIPVPMNILLFCEAVTLAHSARVAVLARGLAARGHRLTVAGAAAIARFEHPRVTWRELDCIGAGRFVRALSRGTAAYAEADLRRYVDEERRCIDAVAPDFVAADFRPTAAVSARLAGVPCAAIVNAYWSPAATGPLPMPVLPFTRALPLPLAQWLFDRGHRWVLPSHCRPWNRVRAAYGLDDLGTDLRRIYSDADVVLYPDIPGMFALGRLPPHHHFLGPLLWSPAAPRPPWWGGLAQGPSAPPLAYVTLGSSGNPALLDAIVDGLAAAGFRVMAAAAGAATHAGRARPGVLVAPYLPGDEATALAELVVCNGGAMTCHQAFACGKPVLGVPGNMDQFLNMQGVVSSAAGLVMRADRVSAEGVCRAALRLAGDPSFRSASRSLGARMQAIDPFTCFEQAMHDSLRGTGPQAGGKSAAVETGDRGPSLPSGRPVAGTVDSHGHPERRSST